MPKKEGNIKESKSHNWNVILIVLIIAAVFLILISNNFSSGTGSAVRGSGSKKPDLTPYGSNLEDISYKYGENGTELLASVQVGLGVGNIGTTRAKESILEGGIKGDSLEGVMTSAFVIYSTGAFQSATTSYYNVLADGASIGIKVNPLQAGTGEVYTIHFLNIPIPLPPPDGTPIEQKFTFYGIADVTSVISESNENNNKINRSYILRCAYDPPGSLNPFCCVKRLDPLSNRYAGVRYCEDYGIY